RHPPHQRLLPAARGSRTARRGRLAGAERSGPSGPRRVLNRSESKPRSAGHMTVLVGRRGLSFAKTASDSLGDDPVLLGESYKPGGWSELKDRAGRRALVVGGLGGARVG